MSSDVFSFKQNVAYSCGAVSLQTALDFFGVFKMEEKRAKESHAEFWKAALS